MLMQGICKWSCYRWHHYSGWGSLLFLLETHPYFAGQLTSRDDQLVLGLIQSMDYQTMPGSNKRSLLSEVKPIDDTGCCHNPVAPRLDQNWFCQYLCLHVCMFIIWFVFLAHKIQEMLVSFVVEVQLTNIESSMHAVECIYDPPGNQLMKRFLFLRMWLLWWSQHNHLSLCICSESHGFFL